MVSVIVAHRSSSVRFACWLSGGLLCTLEFTLLTVFWSKMGNRNAGCRGCNALASTQYFFTGKARGWGSLQGSLFFVALDRPSLSKSRGGGEREAV